MAEQDIIATSDHSSTEQYGLRADGVVVLRSHGSLGDSAWEVYDAAGMTLAEFTRLVGIANAAGAGNQALGLRDPHIDGDY